MHRRGRAHDASTVPLLLEIVVLIHPRGFHARQGWNMTVHVLLRRFLSSLFSNCRADLMRRTDVLVSMGSLLLALSRDGTVQCFLNTVGVIKH